MKKINGEIFLSIGEASKIVGRSNQTIKNWYKWCQAEGIDEAQAGLPKYRRDLDGKQTYYFAEADVPKLIQFRDGISYGQMSDFNVTRWGQRGKDIEARKVELEQNAQESVQETN